MKGKKGVSMSLVIMLMVVCVILRRQVRRVVQMAAVPEVEGKSLEMFLTWLAREGGWTLQYSDPRLAREAPNTIMRGDVQGLSALEAAELALGSSELRFRVTGQVLLIEPLDDP